MLLSKTVGGRPEMAQKDRGNPFDPEYKDVSDWVLKETKDIPTSKMQAHAFISVVFLLTLSLSDGAQHATCRCMPGDSCWPSSAEWARLNATTGGKLIKTIPLAEACHSPNYNAAKCHDLQSQWNSPFLHDQSPSSIMAAAVANESCDAFTSQEKPCTLGNMVSFTINATGSSDFARAIHFSQKHNMRLVVRNTGHDYLGKSTGAGALSIWTHHMQDIEFVEKYISADYSGPAFKLLAGVQVENAYAAAHKKGFTLVGGDCATVGVAGGYTQGGGHSALTSKFGLAADQVLEFQVMDGYGKLHTTSRTKNPDLHWALSGGGGGTYGIVYSVTVRAHQDFPVTGAVLSFNSTNTTKDAYYEAIEYYHSMVSTYTAEGATTIGSVSADSFLLTPLTLPNGTVDDANAMLKSFKHKLESLSIPYFYNATYFPSWYTFYMDIIEPNPTQLVQNGQYGGWFVPSNVIEHHNSNLTAAVRTIVEDGTFFTGIGINGSSKFASAPVNAVHPSWRISTLSVILASPWPNGADMNKMKTLANKMTHKWVPALEALAPNAGAYMSEADPQQPNWQKAFYSTNYDKLLSIKRKYDPLDTFYAPTAVGSDAWTVGNNGALCRKAR